MESPEPQDSQEEPEEYEISEPVQFQEMLQMVQEAIDGVDEELSEESLEGIGVLLPEDNVISAFNILDRGNVIKYIAPWGKVDYEIIGESRTRFIQMDLPSRIPWYCSCSAFHTDVLLQKSHVMCKHILATLLARKLSVTMERPISADELLEIFQKRYTTQTDTESCTLQQENLMVQGSPEVSIHDSIVGGAQLDILQEHYDGH